MDLSSRTALVTGGTSGIGLGLAKALLESGSRVIVCGRNEERLAEVEKAFPGITAMRCDVAVAKQREKLARDVVRKFPKLDMLVNNAGIQRYVDLKKGYAELKSGEDEIAVNFVAVVELTTLLVDHLMTRPEAAIANVSSGLGFMPMLSTPVYSATKAAVHVFTLVLREQLADTDVKVFEIVPPMVDTGLNKEGRDRAHMKYRGIGVSDYIPVVVKGLEDDEETIFYGDGASVLSEPRAESENRLLAGDW